MSVAISRERAGHLTSGFFVIGWHALGPIIIGRYSVVDLSMWPTVSAEKMDF